MNQPEHDSINLYPDSYRQDFEDFKFLLPQEIRKKIRSQYLGKYLNMTAEQIIQDPEAIREYELREKLLNIDLFGMFLCQLNNLRTSEFFTILNALRAKLLGYGDLEDPTEY